jgi:hypothetical protein
MAPASMAVLAAAMTEAGWLPPIDAAAVRAAEDATASLPARMMVPPAVLEMEGPGRYRPAASLAPSAEPLDIDASLRRAAREPGTLTPQVRERMCRDREAGRARRQDPRRQGEES